MAVRNFAHRSHGAEWWIEVPLKAGWR